jgi:HK97 gp10 family phage protein
VPNTTGLKTIFGNIDASVEEMYGAAREVVIDVGTAAAKDAKRLAPISERRTDREAGELKESIDVLSVETTPRGTWCTFGTRLWYAGWVELGTSKTRPHPFMRPAKAKARATIRRRCRVIFKARVRALKGL